jgi:hypothetical protein
MKNIEYIIGHMTEEMKADLIRRGCVQIKFLFWSRRGTPVHMGVMQCYVAGKSLELAA